MELVTLKDMESGEPVRAVAERLNTALEEQTGRSILLLVAGGSSSAVLEHVRSELLGEHVLIGMSDERLSDDPNVNNFAQLTRSHFYTNATERGATFIDTKVKIGETVQALGRRMDEAFHAWRETHPDGVVLLTQGVGPDGHTCGIMPFPEDAPKFHELFEKSEVWAVGYDASGKNQFPLRATVTLSFLREQVGESIVYAMGSERSDVLKKVMKQGAKLNELPAFIVRLMKKVTLFTDQTV